MKRICTFFYILLFLLLSIKGYTQKHSILRDKYSYETALEMYSLADTIAYDSKAEALLSRITKQLNSGSLPEEDIVWKDLIELEPYRFAKPVQSAVKNWVDMSYNNILSKKYPNTVKDINRLLIKLNIDRKQDEINKEFFYDISEKLAVLYLDNELDKVALYSRELLSKIPRFNKTLVAIRNNFALSLMHQNMDLCALLELEIIRALEKPDYQGYIPALINLSVVYERLGRSEESKALALFLEEKQVNIPMVDFNAEWWRIGDNFILAGNVLKKSEIGKYQLLANYKDSNFYSRPVFEIGVLKKYGKIQNTSWAVFIFILISIILLIFFRIILKKYSTYRKGCLSCILFFILISAFYLLMMGSTTPIFGIIYLLVFFIAAFLK